MTNPIQLLKEKLQEIKEVEQLCHDAENYQDLGEIQRQKHMYTSSIHYLEERIKIIS